MDGGWWPGGGGLTIQRRAVAGRLANAAKVVKVVKHQIRYLGIITSHLICDVGH